MWPTAIHEGNGKAAFIVEPATTDRQVEVLSQIFTGQLGGLPWELLGPTFPGRRPGRKRQGSPSTRGFRAGTPLPCGYCPVPGPVSPRGAAGPMMGRRRHAASRSTTT